MFFSSFMTRWRLQQHLENYFPSYEVFRYYIRQHEEIICIYQGEAFVQEFELLFHAYLRCLLSAIFMCFCIAQYGFMLCLTKQYCGLMAS